MGFEEDRRPSWGLGRLYREQLTGRPLYSDDEAAKTSIMDSSTYELREDVCSSRSFRIRFVPKPALRTAFQKLMIFSSLNVFCICRRLAAAAAMPEAHPLSLSCMYV
jgi:hypothetical protein